MPRYEVTTHDDNNPTEIIEARHCKDQDGALYFYDGNLIRAFAAGSWHGMKIIAASAARHRSPLTAYTHKRN